MNSRSNITLAAIAFTGFSHPATDHSTSSPAPICSSATTLSTTPQTSIDSAAGRSAGGPGARDVGWPAWSVLEMS